MNTLGSGGISLGSIVTWVIFGFIVGFIIHLIDNRDVRGGVVSTTLTGILGALIGGFLSNAIFGVGVTGFNLTSFIIAVVGALLLVLIQRMVSRRVV
jgi:uncharacterized membrane protein YeaQ/YmgE (transglycosylase-associated protein family)